MDGPPEEICEQLQPYVEAGVDQLAFGVPGDGSYDDAFEMIEVFGKRAIPDFDRDPVISSDRYRPTTKAKYPTFNKEPLPISTFHTP